jgi:hypothetical protein
VTGVSLDSSVFFKHQTNFIAGFCVALHLPIDTAKTSRLLYISNVSVFYFVFFVLFFFLSVSPSVLSSMLSICMIVCTSVRLSHFFLLFFFYFGVAYLLIDMSHSLCTALIGTVTVGFI